MFRSVSRIWLPLAIAIAGVVLLIVGRGSVSSVDVTGTSAAAGAGVGLLIVAVIVWMINWMFRMSIDSNADREREEMAREYFDVHGHWPDERPRDAGDGSSG